MGFNYPKASLDLLACPFEGVTEGTQTLVRPSPTRHRLGVRTVAMDERDAQPGPGRSEWNVDPTTDYPVGPDDAGNAVMHGIGFLVTGWRCLFDKIRTYFESNPDES